jgi:hypothetical protein
MWRSGGKAPWTLSHCTRWRRVIIFTFSVPEKFYDKNMVSIIPNSPFVQVSSYCNMQGYLLQQWLRFVPKFSPCVQTNIMKGGQRSVSLLPLQVRHPPPEGAPTPQALFSNQFCVLYTEQCLLTAIRNRRRLPLRAGQKWRAAKHRTIPQYFRMWFE